MDINRYYEALKKGQKVTIHQEGRSFFVDYQKFDIDLGVEVESEREAADLGALVLMKEGLDIQSAKIQKLIDQITTLPDTPIADTPVAVDAIVP